jgi:hypothetical protein
MDYQFVTERLAVGGSIGTPENMREPKRSELFWKGVQFSLEALAEPQSKIYFHCAAGVHRGPLMLLAVLRVLGYQRREAMDLITNVRPQANFPPIYVMSVEDFCCEYRATLQSK